ncbi:MAG: hydrogenase formation protein HypD [Bacillota bacterium]|nr:hydrogenase formation protein HypD [Bacillota bacterium]
MKLEQVISALQNYKKEIKIMEVCGTHTSAIVKGGIRDLISPSIRLVSGPGCPVCVTPKMYIDRLVDYAFAENTTVLSFGDMFKVPGTKYSLSEAKAEGASAEVVYSPLQSIELAKLHPEKQFIVTAVGFETTAPIYALLIEELIKENINNVKILTSLKTIIPALRFLCEHEVVDGFLSPGHVSVIIGSDAYNELCENYKKPFVIAGFDTEKILLAIYDIIYQIEKKDVRVENMYESVVSKKGQKAALSILDKYFESCDAYWRGVGEIKDSGLILKEEFSRFDAGSRSVLPDKADKHCRCGEVILGRIYPNECAMFGKACTPLHPEGACMVSSEGACGIWYANGGAN